MGRPLIYTAGQKYARVGVKAHLFPGSNCFKSILLFLNNPDDLFAAQESFQFAIQIFCTVIGLFTTHFCLIITTQICSPNGIYFKLFLSLS